MAVRRGESQFNWSARECKQVSKTHSERQRARKREEKREENGDKREKRVEKREKRREGRRGERELVKLRQDRSASPRRSKTEKT